MPDLDDFEDRVRAMLVRHADNAPSPARTAARLSGQGQAAAQSPASVSRRGWPTWVLTLAAACVILAVVGTLAVAGVFRSGSSRRSTAAAATSGTPSSTTATSSTPQLTPHVPNPPSPCASYAINATTVRGTVPLASCTGLAGVPSRVLRLKVGEQLLLSGMPRGSGFQLSNTVLSADGHTLTADRPGSVHVIARGVPCTTYKATTCPLLVVVVQAPPTAVSTHAGRSRSNVPTPP
ncbi:hypothetical protein [uncultured Jatrophihabitans sp.]|uniref:hypothetical protein n=1 Tax=uncultured Jatrophihabitans sp. TaxID=1610747 RepID=UPI0035CBEA2D